MSEIQRLPQVMNPNPVHPNAKSTTQITNGTTTTKTSIGLPVCRNCKTQTTPLWRRDETGQVLCNACGLFLKLHGRPRPISLKTDTIKLRNRIKQLTYPKSPGPNTPELKLKDSKISIQPNGAQAGVMSGRVLPLSMQNIKRLPSSQQDAGMPGPQQGPFAAHHQPHGITPHQPLTQAPFTGGVFPLMGHHFAGPLPPNVQLLHYPSLTPTQFAPGLQRITSPLLLSTTPSVLNARSSAAAANVKSPTGSLTAMQAAGALENMLNELGPSASFKGSSQPGSSYSLLGGSALSIKSENSSSSIPALSSPKPPLLPALGATAEMKAKVMASPSFGPQFSLLDSQGVQRSVEHSMSALPPIQTVATSGKPAPPQLPHISSNLSSSYSAASTPEQLATPALMPQLLSHQVPLQLPSHAPLPLALQGLHLSAQIASMSGNANRAYGNSYPQQGSANAPTSQPSAASGAAPTSVNGSGDGAATGRADGLASRGSQDANSSNNDNSNNDDNNNNQGGGPNANSSNNAYEVNVLKTRISELELVNDLYRTRIMELEAMEQAARLRENSMRKRLDDLLRAQGYEESLSMLNNTMRVLKREDDLADDKAKRQRTV